jgi:hypothetical protein
MNDTEKLLICLRTLRDSQRVGGGDAKDMVVEEGLKLLGINPHKSGEIESFIESIGGIEANKPIATWIKNQD